MEKQNIVERAVAAFNRDSSEPLEPCEALQPSQTTIVQRRLAELLGKQDSIDFSEIFLRVQRRADFLDWGHFNMADPLSTIDEAFHQLGIVPPDSLLLLWVNEGEIDRMTPTTLNRLFDYAWTPTKDNILIFPDALSWVMAVNDSGGIQLYIPATGGA